MTIRDRQVLTPDRSSAPVVRQRAPLPIVAGAVIGLSVLRFVLDLSIPPNAVLPWAIYGPAIQRGEWWRLVSYAVEHGGPIHILFNMTAVWTLGIPLERMLGSWRFFIISLATCLGAAAFSLFFAPFDTQMVGASGMILGWAGAMLPISTRAGRRQLGMWLAQVVVISLLPHVSWQGHLGGFLLGLPFGFALRAGPRAFSYLAPLLLASAAAIAVIAGHPGRISF
jgi:membrane associated rhomboid family serine protease